MDLVGGPLAKLDDLTFRDVIRAIGYVLDSDYSLYFNGIILIVAYIDDLALAGPKDLKAITEAKRMLESAFNMKDLSKSKHLLSMAIT